MAGERATVHKLNDAPKAKGKCCISMAYLEGGVRVVSHLIGSSKYVYDEGYSRVAARFVRGQRVTNRRYQPLGERCPIIGRVSKTTTVAPSPPHGTNHVLARCVAAVRVRPSSRSIFEIARTATRSRGPKWLPAESGSLPGFYVRNSEGRTRASLPHGYRFCE